MLWEQKKTWESKVLHNPSNPVFLAPHPDNRARISIQNSLNESSVSPSPTLVFDFFKLCHVWATPAPLPKTQKIHPCRTPWKPKPLGSCQIVKELSKQMQNSNVRADWGRWCLQGNMADVLAELMTYVRSLSRFIEHHCKTWKSNKLGHGTIWSWFGKGKHKLICTRKTNASSSRMRDPRIWKKTLSLVRSHFNQFIYSLGSTRR